jgi:hypothetical protein
MSIPVQFVVDEQADWQAVTVDAAFGTPPTTFVLEIALDHA